MQVSSGYLGCVLVEPDHSMVVGLHLHAHPRGIMAASMLKPCLSQGQACCCPHVLHLASTSCIFQLWLSSAAHEAVARGKCGDFKADYHHVKQFVVQGREIQQQQKQARGA